MLHPAAIALLLAPLASCVAPASDDQAERLAAGHTVALAPPVRAGNPATWQEIRGIFEESCLKSWPDTAAVQVDFSRLGLRRLPGSDFEYSNRSKNVSASIAVISIADANYHSVYCRVRGFVPDPEADWAGRLAELPLAAAGKPEINGSAPHIIGVRITHRGHRPLFSLERPFSISAGSAGVDECGLASSSCDGWSDLELVLQGSVD